MPQVSRVCYVELHTVWVHLEQILIALGYKSTDLHVVLYLTLTVVSTAHEALVGQDTEHQGEPCVYNTKMQAILDSFLTLRVKFKKPYGSKLLI